MDPLVDTTKLLYITDTHGKARNPVSRIDDYAGAVFRKMKYIIEYAENNNFDAILHGGDWLDAPHVSDDFIREFSFIIKRSKVPFYGILGNHDIYGYNPDTFLRTAYSISEGLGVFTRLYRNKPVKVGRAILTGQDAVADYDRKGCEYLYTDSYIESESDHVVIHLTHGMLVDKKWDEKICLTTPVSQIIDTVNADIVLGGHEHIGFGIISKMNSYGKMKTFCNPGSLLRVTSSTGDVRRNCRFATIEINSSGYDVKLHDLPEDIAKPAEEVFDLVSLQKEKDAKKNLQAFIDTANQIDLSENPGDVYNNLKKMADEDNIDEEVYNICVDELKKAEESQFND